MSIFKKTMLEYVSHIRNSFHHGQSHHYGTSCVVFSVIWKATYTVVAVSKDLNPQLMIFLQSKNVKQS